MKDHFKNHFKFEVNELKVTVESLSKSKSNFDLQTEKLEESITTLKGRGSFHPTQIAAYAKLSELIELP